MTEYVACLTGGAHQLRVEYAGAFRGGDVEEGRVRHGIAIAVVTLTGMALLSAAALGQSRLTGGAGPFEHVGLQVVGSGRLGTPSPDSTWSVLAGGGAVWLIRPGLLHPIVLGPPASSGQAFGAAGAIVRGFASGSFDALAIGDPGYSAGRGRVSIYLGSPAFTSAPSLTLEGETAGDLFGSAVAYVGDVNGDSFGDLAVGAPGRSSGAGKVYVFLGGPSPSSTAAASANGGAAGDLSGSAVAGIGDLNQDGFSDFAVGAPGVLGGRGAVSLFRGGVILSSVPNQVISYPGPTPAYGERPRFGSALTGGGDLDGDGEPDFVVGAPGVAAERGSAFVFHGASGTVDPAGREISGTATNDHLGSSLTLGKLTDGITTDLVVCSPGAGEGRGTASIFAGGASFDLTPDRFVSGIHADDGFGSSVGTGKLFTKATAVQLMIGAPFADDGAENGGVAYYYAAPPAVAVEESQLTVEADGTPLRPNAYTSTSPALRLRLPGATSLDAASAEITLDGAKVANAGAMPGNAGQSDGIAVQLTGLAEGPHTLGARVYDTAHSRVGLASVTFNAAARLRIEAPRVIPNPTFVVAQLRFTLTRPAGYVVQLFDVSGRRVDEIGPATGLPAENVVRLGTGAELPVGLYFFVVRASYQDQRATAKGRVILRR